MTSQEDFFKDRYFDSLNKSVADIGQKVDDMQKDISDIKTKVVYMYGFAAGIGVISSFIIDYIRTKFVGH